MGKYDKNYEENVGKFTIEGVQTHILNYIANELAEANRLKRIELRIRITQVNTKDFKEDTISNWYDDLEDKT